MIHYAQRIRVDTIAEVPIPSMHFIGDLVYCVESGKSFVCNGSEWIELINEENIDDFGGGGGQSWKVDRIPVESANGVRTLFTLPSSDTYISDNLTVYLNGLAQTKTNDFTETSSTTFTFVSAPATGDVIRLIYRTA